LARGLQSSFQSAINLGSLLLLVMHLLHDVTIIMHIHEEVLAPLGTRLRVVAEHHAFEFHTQRRLRS